jgi:hypothetical protein
VRFIPFLIVATAFAATPSITQAQGVDYHKAQQAGKVWRDKQNENNRKRGREAKVNSAGIAENAPISAADRQRFLATHQADYDRLLRSVGRKNAELWLSMRLPQVRADW